MALQRLCVNLGSFPVINDQFPQHGTNLPVGKVAGKNWSGYDHRSGHPSIPLSLGWQSCMVWEDSSVIFFGGRNSSQLTAFKNPSFNVNSGKRAAPYLCLIR